MLVVCERRVGDGNRLLHIDPCTSDHSRISLSSCLGCSTLGHWGPQSPQSASCSHAGILSPTDSNWPKPSRAPGYIIVLSPPNPAVLPLIYTGASLDWRLGQGSICYTNDINKNAFMYQLVNYKKNIIRIFKIYSSNICLCVCKRVCDLVV